MAHELLEHAHLGTREGHDRASHFRAMPRRINGDGSELDRSARRAARFARTTQNGAQTSSQLTWVERLRQIVVGTKLEAQNSIDVIAASGEHQHRRHLSPTT